MSNEVKIKITSDADTKGFKEADKALADTKVSAKGVSAEISGLTDNMTKSDRAGSSMGRTITSNKDRLTQLDAATAQSSKTLTMLAQAFADTDDAAQKLDIQKAMKRADEDIRNNLKARKHINVGELIDPKPDQSFFTKWGNGLAEGAAPLAAHAGPTIGAALALAIGPTLVSGVGAALAGSVGAAGIGGGILVATMNSPEIKKAGKELAKNLMTPLKADAAVFVKPVLSSIDDVEAAGLRLEKRLGDAWFEISDDVQPFIGKLITLGETLGNVLIKKIGESGPSLDALGDGLVMLGDGVGDFLDELIDTGPEAASNLRLILGATKDLLDLSATGIKVFKELGTNPYLTGAVLPLLRKHYDEASDATGTFVKRTSGAADASDDAARAVRSQSAALDKLNTALKASTDPVFAFIDAQNGMVEKQKAYDEAVKKNGRNSADAKEKLRDLTQAAIVLEGATGQLGDSFNGKLTPELKNTLRAAGVTEGAIDDLEKQFKSAKRAGDSFAKDYKASATLNGYRNAKGQLDGLLRDLRAFDGVWTATMITNYRTYGKPGGTVNGGHSGLAHGGIKGAASGMVGSGLTWVGEQGPELVDLPVGSTVRTAGDSQRMMAQGGGGDTEILLRAAPTASRDLMAVLISGLQYECRTAFSGSAQKMLGVPGRGTN